MVCEAAGDGAADGGTTESGAREDEISRGRTSREGVSRGVWRRVDWPCGRFSGVDGFLGSARDSPESGPGGSGFMMLTAGIDAADGKSNFPETGRPGAAPFVAEAGVFVEATGAGTAPCNRAALVIFPLSFKCQALACVAT